MLKCLQLSVIGGTSLVTRLQPNFYTHHILPSRAAFPASITSHSDPLPPDASPPHSEITTYLTESHVPRFPPLRSAPLHRRPLCQSEQMHKNPLDQRRRLAVRV